MGGGSDWLLLVVGSYWLSRFLVRDLGCALCLLQGCHEKRGVRINMTNQRVLSFFLYHTLPLSSSVYTGRERREDGATIKGFVSREGVGGDE